MNQFSPIDPSIIAPELIASPQCAKKQQDQIDQKKFEEELEKQRIKKSDADQKKQRKQPQEETTGIETILTESTESATPTKPSLYSLQGSSPRKLPTFKKDPLKKDPNARFFASTGPVSIPQEENIQLNIIPNIDSPHQVDLEQEKTTICYELVEPMEITISEDLITTPDPAPIKQANPPLPSPETIAEKPIEPDFFLKEKKVYKADQKPSNFQPKVSPPPPLSSDPIFLEPQAPIIEKEKKPILPEPLDVVPTVDPSHEPTKTSSVPVSPLLSQNQTKQTPITTIIDKQEPGEKSFIKPPSIAEKEAEILTQSDAASIFIPTTKSESKKGEKEKNTRSEDNDNSIEANTLSYKPIVAIEKDKEEKEKEKENLALISEKIFFRPLATTNTEAKSHEPVFCRLPPAVFELFERMVGVITVFSCIKGESKTTIDLNKPQFSSSIFFGSQITIVESDSAPKQYNIQFFGSSQAKDLFDTHKEDLRKSFTKGFEEKKFSFQIQQISSSLLDAPYKNTKPAKKGSIS